MPSKPPSKPSFRLSSKARSKYPAKAQVGASVSNDVEAEFEHINWRGGAINDDRLLNVLPAELACVLRQVNGFVQFDGGLHMRGICSEPQWHSLAYWWTGDGAFCRHYDAVEPGDIPFAQDCLGDQFLLRDGRVVQLYAETGEVQPLELGLVEFLEIANVDPIDFLGMEPLLQLQQQSGSLQPGQLIEVYPPLCTEESALGVSVKPVPVGDLIAHHIALAHSLPADGTRFNAGSL